VQCGLQSEQPRRKNRDDGIEEAIYGTREFLVSMAKLSTSGDGDSIAGRKFAVDLAVR